MLLDILFNAFNGLIVGSFYALMAIGLSLILGLNGVINFAHGAFMAMAAYFAFTLVPYTGFWGALFIAPYAALSATAGNLADRFAKPRLIRLYKAMEVGLMVLAALAFLSGNVPALLAVLVGLGVQAALFGPVKYGVLPELLVRHFRDGALFFVGHGVNPLLQFTGFSTWGPG